MNPKFLSWQPYNQYNVLGTNWNIKRIILGAAHQSNGQFEATSRNWNRSYGVLVFENNNFYIAGEY